MLNSLRKIMFALLSFVACSFICYGYATITDTLNVFGSADVLVPDYDEVVIIDVDTVFNTTNYEDSHIVHPTNLNSTVSGSNGQKVVYKVTAHNYSKTKTFIYTGTAYNSSVFETLDKVSISVSQDENNVNVMNNDVSSNAHEGLPIEPGENFVFYVSYTLTDSVSVGEFLVNYSFKQILYTVTYMNNNDIYAVEHVTNNDVVYNVRKEGPKQGSLVFAGWVNANAIVVTSIPAGNTNSYTLSASWENVYIIIFADADGTVLYQEQFTDSSTKLSDTGQATVDQILADLNVEAQKQDMAVSWSEYDIAGAKSDITVKAIYAYDGVLNLVPVYEQPDDGIVDYYKVVAVDELPSTVEVPGMVGGVPVKVVERITNEKGADDWDNFEENVNSIIIGEGVERLERNSLAWTPNLTTVQLPSTINYIGKNAFSRNIALGGFGRGDDKKVLTINYNGTKEQWKAISKDGDWANGLKKGSKVLCSDGYFELEGLLSLSWKEKSY